MSNAPLDDRFEEDTRSVLQRRLTLVFGVLGGVALFYAVSHFVLRLLPVAADQSPPLIAVITFSLGAISALLALRFKLRPRSLTELLLLDAVVTALNCWAIALSLTQVSPRNEASASIVLGTTYVLIARAVFLPSSGWRTLWIGVAALVPAGLVATWLRVDAFGLAGSPRDWPFQGFLVFRNLAVTVFLCALTSHVIYGLRRQVRESAWVGQYLLREKIGEGGMGVVYRATHAMLRRDTAVKLLLPTRVGVESLMRFEREVKLTAQLTHPSTVAIFDYGRTPDGVFYYAMEYLEGGDLERLVEYAGPLPPGRALWMLEQVCRALAEAHALGLIHRDIKPSNVLACERGGEADVAKILDFGLVKDTKAEGDAARSNFENLTGTPLYMSPESIAAPEAVDARGDLYSLGALAYFLLVGQPIFSGKNVVEVCAAHLHSPPPAPSARRPEVNADLDAVILRCLAKRPADRFASASALRAALLACGAASEWSASSSLAWWAQHRQRFRAHCLLPRAARGGASAALETAAGGAIRVDFRGRALR